MTTTYNFMLAINMELTMRNVGGIDKVLRMIIGGVLVVIALDGEQLIGQTVIWAWVGLVPLFTGITGICPSYLLFGYTTAGADNNTQRLR